MSRLLIAFGHKRLRGKDTAGEMAEKHLNRLYTDGDLENSARTDAFAYSLKQSCRIIFGFNDAQLYGDLKEVVDPYWGFTPRWAMQRVGTEAMRNNIEQNIWVRTVENRYNKSPKHVILTDMRFPNEAEGIRRMGGILVKVERDVSFDLSKDGHISETALNDWSDWDHVITNNGTLAELEETTRSIVQGELHKHQLLKEG